MITAATTHSLLPRAVVTIKLRQYYFKAAYADMINTTIDQKGISLSDQELTDLNRGGRMWEEGDLLDL